MKPIGLNASRKTMTLIMLMALILFIEHIGLFNGINNYFYDFFFRLRGPGESSKNIVIVAIDDKTLEKLGRWPLRRLHYASLLKWIKEADTVAFDIIMAEPSKDDAAVGEAIRQHGRVVLPLLINDRMDITYPVIPLASGRTGHIHLEQAIDGVVREVYHTLLYKNSHLPSFTSVIFEITTQKKLKRLTPEQFQGQKVNITQLDRMNINYCGGPGTFERISLSDILEGIYPPSFFRNRICLVGITATGVSDIIMTPFSQERKGTPGVEVHANILNTLLLGNAIQVTPYWISWLSTIFLALLSFFCFLRINELRTAVLTFVMLLCIAAVTYMLFSMFNIWLAPSIFYFTILSIFIVSYAFKFNDAVIELDRAYMTVTPHLRWHEGPESQKQFEKGIKGLLTPGGIYSKAQVLADITNQLIFEKELTDTAIFSDVQSVILFGPGRRIVLANNLANMMSKANSLDISSIGLLMNGLSTFMLDQVDIDRTVEKLYSGNNPVTFNVSFPAPEKKFFKVDASSLTVEGKRYPLFVFSDITKVKELEILKGHVVALVSHEIKTPMTSIQGFSEILCETLEGEMKELAGIVQEESERLIRFLNTFLDISRIEEGKQPINLSSVLLSDVVKDIALEFKAIAEDKGITISTEIPEEISPVMIDRDLTKQCLINLTENALKYSPSGKDVILKLTEEIEYMRADIIDHGIGIKEEEVGMVFEKFYRANSDDAKNIPGSGLGLTFVKEAVEAQGGKVSVESRYGKGSKFSIIFPTKNERETSNP